MLELLISLTLFLLHLHRSDAIENSKRILTILHPWSTMIRGPYVTICKTLTVSMQILASPKTSCITTAGRPTTVRCFAEVKIGQVKITTETNNISREGRRSGRKMSIHQRIDGRILIEVDAIRQLEETANLKMEQGLTRYLAVPTRIDIVHHQPVKC